MERILVIGTGYLGSALARRLFLDGYEVVGLRRHVASPSGQSPAGWLCVTGDINSQATRHQIGRVDAVIITLSPTSVQLTSRAIEPVTGNPFHDAIRASVVAAIEGQAQQILYTSSTGVYGETTGVWVDEDAPLDRVSPRGQLLCGAEDIVASSCVPVVTIARLSGIYGPGRDPLGRYRAEVVSEHQRNAWTNRVHLDDAVEALTLLVRTHRGGVYNVSDDMPSLRSDVMAWMAGMAGEGADVNADSLSKQQEAWRSPRSERAHSKRVSNARLKNEGWQLRFPDFKTGFRSLGNS